MDNIDSALSWRIYEMSKYTRNNANELQSIGLQDNSIQEKHLQNLCVSGSKIQQNAINVDHIIDSQVTASKLSTELQNQITNTQNLVLDAQSQITTLQTQMTSVQTQITSAQNSISDAQNQITTLQTQITQQQGQIQDLQTQQLIDFPFIRNMEKFQEYGNLLQSSTHAKLYINANNDDDSEHDGSTPLKAKKILPSTISSHTIIFLLSDPTDDLCTINSTSIYIVGLNIHKKYKTPNIVFGSYASIQIINCSYEYNMTILEQSTLIFTECFFNCEGSETIAITMNGSDYNSSYGVTSGTQKALIVCSSTFYNCSGRLYIASDDLVKTGVKAYVYDSNLTSICITNTQHTETDLSTYFFIQNSHIDFFISSYVSLYKLTAVNSTFGYSGVFCIQTDAQEIILQGCQMIASYLKKSINLTKQNPKICVYSCMFYRIQYIDSNSDTQIIDFDYTIAGHLIGV